MSEKNKVNMRDKRTLPEEGKTVMLHGSDCFGDWKIKGILKNFKSLPHKKSLPYRFVSLCNDRVDYVEFWSEIDG